MIDKEDKTIVIPSKTNTVYIDKPTEVKVYDTIYNENTIVKIVEVESKPNEELLKKYEDANDSIHKLALYVDAIKERNYIETLEDSVQMITVSSSVIGTLKSQSISYVTKPIVIDLKPTKIKPSIYVSGFAEMPTNWIIKPTFGIRLTILNKRTIYSLGVDNNKTISASIGIRIFNLKNN